MNHYDTLIIGGGLVGLSCAYNFLTRFPGKKLLLIEKEPGLASHQSGRNSGVLHSGIYYKPNSYKAKNCLEGKFLLEEFCSKHGIPYKICGKIIVASNEGELPMLQTLLERGLANGVPCKLLGTKELQEIEPYVSGIQGLHVKNAGIVDFPKVACCLKQKILDGGGELLCNTKFLKSSKSSGSLVVETTKGGFEAKTLVNCAGLYSDKVLKASGSTPSAKIIPFRGEYYMLKPEAAKLCNALIYPVPDPKFPFLGVHLTRMIHDQVECGPNAVLAFAREGYHWGDINLGEFWESLTYPGFQKLAMKTWKDGLHEIVRSLSKKSFTKAIQKLVPAVRENDLLPAQAGVRAQAMDKDGKLVDDFLIEENDNSIHVLNAPSPAATSCLSIGKFIVERISQRLE